MNGRARYPPPPLLPQGGVLRCVQRGSSSVTHPLWWVRVGGVAHPHPYGDRAPPGQAPCGKLPLVAEIWRRRVAVCHLASLSAHCAQRRRCALPAASRLPPAAGPAGRAAGVSSMSVSVVSVNRSPARRRAADTDSRQPTTDVASRGSLLGSPIRRGTGWTFVELLELPQPITYDTVYPPSCVPKSDPR